MIKYGMQRGFEKNGWETGRLELSEHSVEGLTKKIEEFRPDYLFTEGGVDTRRFIYPVLEQCDIPHIYWAVEDPVANGNMAMEWAKRSVLTLTPDMECTPNYQKNGHRAICIPFAMDPDYYYQYAPDPHFSELDAVHIGNNYDVFPERRKAYGYIIQPFIDRKARLEVYGFDWRNPRHSFNLPGEYDKGYMAHERSVVAYSSAKIMLGVHSVTNSRTMHAMRTFEVLGCGGFFLTQRTRAIKSMFEERRHLVASSSYEETAELMDYYLRSPSKRKKIAEDGRLYVNAEHNYERRAKEIIGAL